jgi:16S rRNA (guanine1516-N2)-methyltransferase
VDSVTLARLGYQVLVIERNPMIAKLLNRALETWDSPLNKRLQFFEGESSHVVDLLRQKKILALPESEKYTLAYFDPMFPRKKKSALPKQEIVILQKLTNEDPDSLEILQKIIQLKFFKRIVIKRPISALPLVKPTSSLKGKLIRYDIIDFDI